MTRFFHLDLPFWRFALNSLALSVVGILPLLAVFVLLTPGFASMLLGNGEALSRFLRQVVTTGLPVVFVVNYLSLFLLTLVAEGHISPGRAMVSDVLLRPVLFVALHGLSYALSADWFDSFGGDRMLALRVVGPTLQRSWAFENISGVYLYATLVAALPLQIVALTRAGWARGLGTLGLAVLAFAVSVAMTTAMAGLMVSLLD